MAIKSTAPLTVSAANIAGWQVPDLVQFATLVYLVVIISYKLWHWYLEAKGYQVKKEDDNEL